MCEVGLRHAAPRATAPKQDAERELISRHPAGLTADPAVLNDLRGQVRDTEPALFDLRGHRFPLPLTRILTGRTVAAHVRTKPSRWNMPRTNHYLLGLLMSAVLAIPALALNPKLPNGEKAMLDPQMLADRYVAVWNETDEKRRRDAIAALWMPNGEHFVAAREVRGYEELEKRIRGSHEKNVRDDGNRFRAAPGARRLRDVVTFHWEMLPADGDKVLARGVEFLIINDEGRILIDYQFFPA
jgi:hypothetical protein